LDPSHQSSGATRTFILDEYLLELHKNNLKVVL
jgi:hypothetical protein